MRLTLAQLRALVALAEEAAADSVRFEPYPYKTSVSMLAAPVTDHVAAAEHTIVWPGGDTTPNLGPLGFPRAR